MNVRLGRADLSACLSFGVLIAAGYAPELLGLRSFFFFDVSSLNIPARDWGFRQIAAGHFPEWCTHWYAGFPFIAESQSGIYYPPNYFFFLLFPSWYATTLTYCCHLWLAGIGAYLLFRRSASPSGAWIGAASFALGGRLLEHQIHAAVVETIAWLPWVILGAVRFIEDGKRRALLWSALAAGVQASAGSLQTVVICHLTTLIYVGSLAWGNRSALWRGLICVVAVGIASVALSAALLVPTFELFLQSPRSGGGAADWANFGALSPVRWVQFIWPGAFGSPAYNTAWLDDRDPIFESGLYHGGAVCFLALLGLFASGVRKRPAFVGAAMTLIGLSLAAGDMNLLGAGLRRLPVFSGIRVPARFLLLVGFGMCLLASLGWDEIVQRFRETRRLRIAVMAMMTALVVGAGWWMYRGILGPYPDHVNAAGFNAFLENFSKGLLFGDAPRLAAAVLGIGLCSFAFVRRRWGFLLFAVLLSFDLHWSVRLKYPTIDPAFHRKPTTIDVVKDADNPDPPRIFVHWRENQARGVDLNLRGWRVNPSLFDKIGDSLYYERGAMFDVGVFPDVGQLPLQPKRLEEFRTEFGDGSRLHIFGIDLEMHFLGGGARRVLRRGVDCSIHQGDLRSSYAFFSTDIHRMPSDRVLRELASDELGQNRFRIVLEGEAETKAESTSPAVTATAKWNGPNALELSVHATAIGAVLIHEMFDHGWRATVDGAPAAIERANFLFMAVPVEPGDHRIVLIYAPASVRWGRWISLVGLAVWFVTLLTWGSMGVPAISFAARTPRVLWVIVWFVVVFTASWLLLADRWADAFPTVIPSA
jgi:hypothetical protein